MKACTLNNPSENIAAAAGLKQVEMYKKALCSTA
jgi:hypothetical protein